ncbi:kinetochore-associated protein DSN1 homolog isoform X2 [Engystomops pustulosus]|uniref:kinetochore-associated protein DSN1 homolog isoform X2 n=1 Tax=Engystomops pustulosus TaxID=76066 RepID=UPI003AFA766F
MPWVTCDERMEATSNVTPPRSSPRKLLSTPPRTAAAPSPDKRQKNSPNNLSFKETSPSPRQRRRSLRRSVGKKHRRTLPPIYHNPTELSEAISSELPESERLSALLHSCFEFSLRNLENSLSRVDGFSSESFQLSAMTVKEKFQRFVERLSRDGTFQRCTETVSSFMEDEEFEAAQAEIKEDISKFTTESSRWEEILEEYKEKAVVLTKKLEESKVSSNPLPDVPDVASSQDQVLRSKPDYSAIVQQQGAVFDCMEIVMDNIQQSIGFLNSFLDDRTSHLQQLSTQLKSQSFKPMEDSPVRTFLKVYKK